MIYNAGNEVDIPSVDLLTLLFDTEHSRASESTPIHANVSDVETTTLTKADARAATQQIAYWLREKYGIGANQGDTLDDVVVVCSGGQAALPCLFYGIVAAEGIYSAASPLLDASGLMQQMKDGPCRLLVCSTAMRAVALAAAEGAGLPMSNVVIISTDPLPRLESADKSTSWKYERETQALLPWRPITDPDELRTKTICLVYSSGTTGVPKGVRISHANMVAEVFLPATINRPIWDQWAVAGRPFETRTIAHLGTGHISGVQGYFVNAFFEGGIVYWMPQFDLATFLSSISALRITTFFSLPRIYAAITLNPATEAADLTSLRIAYSGGMPLDPRVYGSPKLRRAGHDSVLLSQTWGSTETTGAATHMPPDRYDDTGSVGILLPNVTMRLVDNNGNDVEPGQPGEAWLRGPIITQGYHRSPSNSRPVFSDGWYRTGDFIECRGDQLYVLGRLEDMIKYRDFLVPPAELEALLVQYPGVADVVVIGTSVEYDGISTQVPRALVSLQPGIEASDSLMEELAIYVNSKVPDHKKLRGGVKFISKVPRHVSGKLLRDQAQKL